MVTHAKSSRKLVLLVLAAFSLIAIAACATAEIESQDSAQAPTAAVSQPSGPVQVSESIEATSKDGVLFDLKLALPVFDQNGANGRRDDAEILSPDKTEYQGIFADGPGTLFIVSCLADVCQTDTKTATFEVTYWVEELPAELPDGVTIYAG